MTLSSTLYTARAILMASLLIVVIAAVTSGPTRADPSSLATRLTDFVQLDYLGVGIENHVTSPTLFASRIDYYGKQSITRAQMMRDRMAYYDKWPERAYVMLPDSLRIRERDRDTVDVTFDYRFEVANNTKQLGGIGRTELTILLNDDGGFTILAEGGRVLERF